MERQRQLERCDWEFFRVRGSAFYANKDAALEKLWPALEEREIFPGSTTDRQEAELGENENDEADAGEAKDNGQDGDGSLLSTDALEGADKTSGRRVEDVEPSEIRDVILQVLSKCPNQSCTVDSMTSRVLKELGIVTRGKPRNEFTKQVGRRLTLLEKQGRIETYKAKNRRVRLLQRPSSRDDTPDLFR